MSAFSQAAIAGFRTLQSVAGAAVTYIRGNGSVVLTAVPARGNLQVEGESLMRQYQTQDFIVIASDLVIAAVAILPKSGDRIRQVNGSSRLTYEVESPPYTTSDMASGRLRIHTKLIKTEAV